MSIQCYALVRNIMLSGHSRATSPAHTTWHVRWCRP